MTAEGDDPRWFDAWAWPSGETTRLRLCRDPQCMRGVIWHVHEVDDAEGEP